MTKKQFIELIQTKYNGGQTTPDIIKKLHPAVVSEYISMALNVVFYEIFKTKKDGLDSYARWFYDQDVKKGKYGKYSDLPVSLVQMPDGGSSIKRITLPNDNSTVNFLESKAGATGIIQRIGVSDRMGVTIFDVTDKINYHNIDTLANKVNILAIVPFSDLDENDEIVIPQGQDKNLMDLVFNFIVGKVENDNVIDAA